MDMATPGDQNNSPIGPAQSRTTVTGYRLLITGH